MPIAVASPYRRDLLATPNASNKNLSTPFSGASLRSPSEFNKHSTSSCSAVDGFTAASHVAYGLSDVALIYSVTACPGQATLLQWAEDSLPNCFGQTCQVSEIATKTGAGATLHGALASGSLASVVASSQSLVEMLPVMHRLVADRLSCVFHVAASQLKSDLTVVPGYADVLAAAHSGFALLNAGSVQECHDLALVAHLASSRASLPFVQFFDGTRTATEVSKIQTLSYTKISKLAEHLHDREVSSRSTVPKKQIPDIVDEVMGQLRRVLKRRYRLFEYSGSAHAEHVVLSLCSQGETSALEQAVKSLNRQGRRVGLLRVRLLRPWSAKHLLQSLPTGTLKRVAVVVGAQQGRTELDTLFSDVAATVHTQGVQVFATSFASIVDEETALSLFARLSDDHADPVLKFDAVAEPVDGYVSTSELPADVKKLVAWDLQAIEDEDDAPTSAALGVSQILGDYTGSFTHGVQRTDAYSLGGAASATYVHVSPAPFATAALNLSAPADFLSIHNTRVLDKYNTTANLKDAGVVLVNTPDTSVEALEDALPALFRQDVAVRNLQLMAVSAVSPLHLEVALMLLPNFHCSFKLSDTVELVQSTFARALAARHGVASQEVIDLIEETAVSLKLVEVPSSWAVIPEPEVEETKEEDKESKDNEVKEEDEEEDEEPAPLPTEIRSMSIIPAGEGRRARQPSSTVGAWHKAAWHLLFPEAYDTSDGLKVDEKEETYLVNVSVNRRLTPNDYSRNVFHLELDTTGTGLKYEIGDALGIYAHNRKCDVDSFIEFYQLDGNKAVTIEHEGKKEVRTVEQLLTQHLDLFGRPSRRFYASLADFATDPKEKKKLEWLSGPEGGPQFKLRVDKTTTYNDLLREFPSCHPTFSQLLELVPAIKPRHYSIASSMKMHPDSVHLLIVLVEWEVDGVARFGQCTKYLVDLPVDAKVTVCVKPSVMKLPEDHAAPVVMAGLGTGMAPFRAFIQERAVFAAQGIEVGPMVLYFGSRSQAQEYLYGEELEAYHDSGLLTFLRCAFSRDGPKKVYIQHKIQEDARMLHDYLHNRNGNFYLCGPTWPAGDVQDAITSAFVRFGKMDAKEAGALIAEMKEHERYVLEVY